MMRVSLLDSGCVLARTNVMFKWLTSDISSCLLICKQDTMQSFGGAVVCR